MVKSIHLEKKLILLLVIENLLETKNPLWLKLKIWGPGIPYGVREKIFNPFERGANDKKLDIKGTGLGLMICKQLIELLKGEIGLKDNDPEGSNFWFKIPLRAAENEISKTKGGSDKIFRFSPAGNENPFWWMTMK